jgi:hypothetical protein
VEGKHLRGLAVCGVLLMGSFAVAQNSSKEKAKDTPLINSIQGLALSKAYWPPVTVPTRRVTAPWPSRSKWRHPT